MKFRQLNIFSFNTSLNQLWLHQLENNYNAIFLQETNYKEGNLLGNFMHWKVRMHTIFKNKSLGIGVGTLLTSDVKNVFKDDLIRDDLEIAWNEIKTEGEKVLVGNIYVPPKNEEQLHTLEEVFQSLKNDTIILLRDFNARNAV